jgi:hypothetical protein
MTKQPVQLISRNPIVIKIAEGSATDEVLEMLVHKQLPLTEEESLESLVFAMKTEGFKTQALELLKHISDSTKSSYVDKREASHRVAFYILLEALNWKKDSAIAKIIKNQIFPADFLVRIAQRGDPEMLEMLLENQIKLIAYPEIMEAMTKNPKITKFVLGRIQEIREYYLEQNIAEEIPAEEVLDEIKETLLKEQENNPDALSQDDESDVEEDLDSLEGLEEVEQKALTTLQEINNMNIAERIKLAFNGNKTHRMILIKDTNKMVSLAVIESPKLSIDEVTQILKNKSIAGEIIGKIARNREWTKNYPVILELVQNPKTPVKDALSYIKKLHYRDLRQLTRNKNVSPVIRNLAFNYFSQKSGINK